MIGWRWGEEYQGRILTLYSRATYLEMNVFWGPNGVAGHQDRDTDSSTRFSWNIAPMDYRVLSGE
jgi:hypothetical protein